MYNVQTMKDALLRLAKVDARKVTWSKAELWYQSR